MYHRYGKRLLDLALTIPALILLTPILALLVLLVRLTLGSPALFRQKRPGRHGQVFSILKFRTMTDARDTEGNLLPDPERLTRFGRFLRTTSLDELPELINVLKGEMSLVGPRPLLIRYLDRYASEQSRRHEVLPGITGWAQIHGRTALDWDKKFELDVWYVDNYNLWLDLKILAITVIKTIRCEDVSEPPGGVWTEFWGTQGLPSEGPLAYPVEENELHPSANKPKKYPRLRPSG